MGKGGKTGDGKSAKSAAPDRGVPLDHPTWVAKVFITTNMIKLGRLPKLTNLLAHCMPQPKPTNSAVDMIAGAMVGLAALGCYYTKRKQTSEMVVVEKHFIVVEKQPTLVQPSKAFPAAEDGEEGVFVYHRRLIT
jgi:hypothetical protein